MLPETFSRGVGTEGYFYVGRVIRHFYCDLTAVWRVSKPVAPIDHRLLSLKAAFFWLTAGNDQRPHDSILKAPQSGWGQ